MAWIFLSEITRYGPASRRRPLSLRGGWLCVCVCVGGGASLFSHLPFFGRGHSSLCAAPTPYRAQRARSAHEMPGDHASLCTSILTILISWYGLSFLSHFAFSIACTFVKAVTLATCIDTHTQLDMSPEQMWIESSTGEVRALEARATRWTRGQGQTQLKLEANFDPSRGPM